MLQVPCLSPPPVYGHSHYKKFWLRQTEVKESVAGVGCEMMKSTSTSSSPEAASSSKRICGKRRPSQVRSSLASPAELERIKVPVNECLSPTSSGEIPAASGWKKSCYSRKTKRGSDGSSGVSSLDADMGAAAPAAGSRSAEDDKSFITMSIEGSPSQELLHKQQPQPQTTTQPEVMLVRHNMSSNESPISSAAASLDCLTSKCKSADSSLLRQDTDEESDSATSSTSQASDNDDTRCRTSFRGHVKRRDPSKPDVVAKDEKCVASVAAGCISSSSPKTRQATAVDSGGLRSPGHGSSPGGMNNVSRTCKHCGTMKTPLWRNGPLGPKSLCNACGIRLRKARRSSGNQEGQTTPTTTTTVPGKRKHNQQQQQAEAGSGAAGSAPTTTTTTTTTFLGGLPYKKSRVSFKREQGSEQGFMAAKLSLLGSKSLSTDEEEGAVLLMALSCGLVLA